MIAPRFSGLFILFKKYRFLLFITLFIPLDGASSSDSLLTVFKDASRPDSVRVRAIHFAAWNLIYHNADSARLLAELEIEFSERKEISMWRMSGMNTIGLSYFVENDYPKALQWFQKSLALSESYENIQLPHHRQEFLKLNTANARHNMGNVYLYMGDYPRAREHYEKSLEIRLASREKYNLSGTYTNLGLVCRHIGESGKALEYFQKSLALDTELENEKGVADNLLNIGSIYQDLFNHDSAVYFYKKSLGLFEELNDQYGILNAYLGMGYSSQKHGLFANALSNCRKALDLSTKLNDAYNEQFCLQCLFETYEKKGEWKNAYDAYREWNRIQDSLFGTDKTRELTSLEMQFDFQKKELQDSILRVEEKKINRLKAAEQEAKLEKEKLEKYVSYAGLFIFILFGGFIYNRFRITRKQKNIIEVQKEEVEKQKNYAEEQHRLVGIQKEIVEEKNKEIIDSINYAKRLQGAILPPVKLFEEILPDSFLIYRPKDIVAGDFYWFEQYDGRTFFAAADCTGHGVPGALVSVVCSNALNRTVKEFNIVSPGMILDKVRELVIDTFSRSEDEVKDGMDISLCSLERRNGKAELSWAGANNPLWIIRNNSGEIEEIKADKQPIGYTADPKPFSTHSVALEKNDSIYIFTDGYEDQFGGEKGKKFKSANLKKLILAIKDLPMDQQSKVLTDALEKWKGDLEQVDDICVIGVRV